MFHPSRHACVKICAAVIAVSMIGAAAAVVHAEGQPVSNEQLELALWTLQSQKKTLEAADHDYGGHRADAVRDINNAERQLRDALGSSNNGKGKGGAQAAHLREPQVLSNQQLRDSMPNVQQTIASLNAADHDYGGHRADAVRDLQKAYSQLGKALQYKHAGNPSGTAAKPGTPNSQDHPNSPGAPRSATPIGLNAAARSNTAITPSRTSKPQAAQSAAQKLKALSSTGSHHQRAQTARKPGSRATLALAQKKHRSRTQAVARKPPSRQQHSARQAIHTAAKKHPARAAKGRERRK